MRIIGIDLAVRSVHKAVVIDEGGRYLSRVIEFHTDVRDLAQLLGAARQGDSGCELWVVMEPTGMAWFPMRLFCPPIQCPAVSGQRPAGGRPAPVLQAACQE